MKVKKCEIRYNKKINEEYYLLGFDGREIKENQPGQFISFSIPGRVIDMPLRRPFTIYNKTKDGVMEVLYKIVGKATVEYTYLEKGDFIEVLGPLGKGFSLVENKKVLLIGRGCGIATLQELGKKLKEKNNKVTTIGSFREKSISLTNKDMFDFSEDVIELFDEDNTSNILNLEKVVKEINPDYIYSSGSKRVVNMLKDIGFNGEVSLEERMACGLGSCVTCPVMTKDGIYKRVCKDGPCFKFEEVIV